MVVDNHSGNDSLARLTAAFAHEPRVVVIATEANLGYAAGNNFGARWRMTQGPVDQILISNNDVRLPDRSTVRVLADFAGRHADLGGVGPRVTTPNGFPQGPYRRPNAALRTMRNLLPVFPLAYRYWRRARGSERAGSVYAVVGAFLLLKAEPFARAGMFDEHTFLGAEEYILAERLRAIGLSFWYYPGVTVIHEHGRGAIARSGGATRHSDRGLASMVYYFETYQKVNPALLSCFRGSARLYNRLLLPFRQRFTI